MLSAWNEGTSWAGRVEMCPQWGRLIVMSGENFSKCLQSMVTPAACCLLPAACCLLPAACCLLSAAAALHSAVCGGNVCNVYTVQISQHIIRLDRTAVNRIISRRPILAIHQQEPGRSAAAHNKCFARECFQILPKDGGLPRNCSILAGYCL